MNEKRMNAKYEIKYERDLKIYQNALSKPTFKNNSNNIKGLFGNSGLELPQIN